jgi:hypothetical protein
MNSIKTTANKNNLKASHAIFFENNLNTFPLPVEISNEHFQSFMSKRKYQNLKKFL